MTTADRVYYRSFYMVFCIRTAFLFLITASSFVNVLSYPIHINSNCSHQGAIWAVAYSPTGTMFASASTDNTIKIWSTSDRRLISTLNGHKKGVWTVAFSPDGKLIASGSCDHTIKIWSHKKLLSTLEGHTGIVTSVVFSPDGKYVASSGSDCSVRLWSVKEYKQIKSTKQHTGLISSIDFSPDGEKIISGSYDHSVRVWFPWISKASPIIGTHEDSIFSVAFSPDGINVASGGFNGDVKIWNIQNKSLQRLFRTNDGSIACCIAYSPDGNQIAAGTYSGRINIWDFSGSIGNYSPEIGHTSYISSIAFAPNGKTLISGSKDSTIAIWRVPPPPIIGSIPKNTGNSSIVSIAYAPQLTPPLLASADGSDRISIWSMKNGGIIRSIPTDAHCTSISFSNDGILLAAGCGSQVTLFSVITGKPIKKVKGHHLKRVHSVIFSPDNSLLASECGDKTILVHSSSGKIIARLKKGWLSKEKITCLVFPPEKNDQLLSGDESGAITLWSISQKKVIKQLGDFDFTEEVTSIAISPDGFRYAVVNNEGTIQIRSFPEDQLIWESKYSENEVTSLCFSHDGSHLATGGLNGTITIRSATTFKIVSVLGGDNKLPIKTLTFAGNDPSTLISGGDDRTIRLWYSTEKSWLLTSYQVMKNDYITLNPKGYFVCSENVRKNPEAYGTLESASHKPTIIDSILNRFIGTAAPPHNLTDNKELKKRSIAITPSHPELPSAGQKYAIIIGIADYQYLDSPKAPGDGLKDLKYSDRDAEAFNAFIKDASRSGGNWKRNFLTNEDATTINFDDALTPILTNATEDDVIYIFFSGHGRCHPNTPDKIYLLTYDFEPSDYRSGFAYDDLLELINESKAGHIVAFIDACKSGTIGFKGTGSNGLFNHDVLKGKIQQFPSNKIIFSSATGTQVSWEDDEFRMGTFSYYLIKGLNGCAPEISEPFIINLLEIQEYVKDEVQKRTRHKILQTPFIFCSNINEQYPLAIRTQGDIVCAP